MPVPTLESLDSLLDEQTVGILGDSLTFNGTALRGFVNYGDNTQGAVVGQGMSVWIRRVDQATEPDLDDRIVLAKRPGQTFRPANVRMDDSGRFWEFDLKRVPA